MSWRDRIRALREDQLLGRVLKNTSYLFSSSTISMGLALVQGLAAGWLLGPLVYGQLGIIMSFASNMHRLLSFRMPELVVKYAGQYLVEGRKDRAAALIKAAGLTEMVSAAVAYGLLALLAPLAARWFVKDAQTAPWIILYGLALLANLVFETSTAVLQITKKFKPQAAFILIQNVITLVLTAAAILFHGGLLSIILAYLVGKAVSSVGITLAAARELKPLLGPDWLRAPFSLLPERREIVKYAVSTNLSGTVTMLMRDSELIYLGLLLNPAAAGYYKFALSIMNLVLLPINPFIATTFPEITEAAARKTWGALRKLLRRTSLIAAAWTLAFGAGLALLGKWFLHVYSDGQYLPALPVIFILLIGYGTANILFWNRPLLLALGKPNYPLAVTTITGVLKVALTFLLVPLMGVNMQAGLMSAYFVISVGLIVWRGLREVGLREREPAQEAA